MDMKKSRVAAVCVAAVIVLAALFLIWQLAGEKGAIQRQLDCVDTKTKQKVTVTVSGTYTHYFFRADRLKARSAWRALAKARESSYLTKTVKRRSLMMINASRSGVSASRISLGRS